MNSSLFSMWRFRVAATLLAFVGAGAVFFLTASMAFAADLIDGAVYKDMEPINGNGTVETIVWTMNETVSVCNYEESDWTIDVAGTINVTAITNVTCAGADISIAVTTTAGITGGATHPQITYTNQGTANSIELTTAGAVATKADVEILDGAAPQIRSFSYQDADFNAKIDTVMITFTETVDGADVNSVLGHNDLLVTVGDFTGLAFGTEETDRLTGSVSSISMTFGTEATVDDTADDSGNFEITSQNAFSLTDGTNTNAVLRAQSVAGATYIDDAGPVLIESTPDHNSAGMLNTSDIVLTFSEAINVATDSISLSPSVSYTETWSSGNSVLTLDGAFAAGQNTVTITTASDSASVVNTFAGAQVGDSTVASPLVFNVAAPSSGSSSSDTDDEEVAYGVTVLSPNGGETYSAGDRVNITWETEGPMTVSGININFVYEEDGVSYQSTIVSGATNDGSYTWTVPNVDTDSASIQIVGTDLVDTLASDTSDASFAIGGSATDGGTGETPTGDDSSTPSAGEMGASPVTGEMEVISATEAGMYIRSNYFDTVYYLESSNGALVRRPFMDAQTFMTWQSNWSNVVTVSDATLPTIALGSPMLPKSGVVLIKIQSNAKVYVVENGNTLRWLTSEEVAIATYGAAWADYVIDVPVTLFGRYEMGEDVNAVESVNMGIMKTRAAVNS